MPGKDDHQSNVSRCPLQAYRQNGNPIHILVGRDPNRIHILFAFICLNLVTVRLPERDCSCICWTKLKLTSILLYTYLYLSKTATGQSDR